MAIDLAGPITPVSAKGNRYILTMVDFATRYSDVTALRNIDTEHFAEALVDMFFRYEIPHEVLSDRGSNCISDVMTEVWRLLSVRQLLTTPYHPICNELIERFNGILKPMLRKMCQERPGDGDCYLHAVLIVHREVPHSSLGFSAF